MSERITLTEGYMRKQRKGDWIPPANGKKSRFGYCPRPKSEIAPPPPMRPQTQKTDKNKE